MGFYVYEEIREFVEENKIRILSKINKLKCKDCGMYVECEVFNFPKLDISLGIGEKKNISQNSEDAKSYYYEVLIDCPEFSGRIFNIVFNGSEWEIVDST